MTHETVTPGEDEDADKALEILKIVSDALGGGEIGSYSVVAQKEDGTIVQETHVEETSSDDET